MEKPNRITSGSEPYYDTQCGVACSFMIRKPQKTAPHLYIYIYIYIQTIQISGQPTEPSINAFQFYVKNCFILVKYKSKVQNLIHFSILISLFAHNTLSHCQSLSSLTPTNQTLAIAPCLRVITVYGLLSQIIFMFCIYVQHFQFNVNL